jgi:hypothetical protein
VGGFMPKLTDSNSSIVLLQCSICSEGVILKTFGSVQSWVQSGNFGQVKTQDQYPIAKKPAAPQHVPTNVASFYLQGEDNVARGHFDASGAMFRKALDTALKAIHPEGKGVLARRIDNLPVETGVTPAMKQWAHEIRHLGNDAAHDEEPFSEAESVSLMEFTRLFLTFAFTLPGMIAARSTSLSG